MYKSIFVISALLASSAMAQEAPADFTPAQNANNIQAIAKAVGPVIARSEQNERNVYGLIQMVERLDFISKRLGKSDVLSAEYAAAVEAWEKEVSTIARQAKEIERLQAKIEELKNPPDEEE